MSVLGDGRNSVSGSGQRWFSLWTVIGVAVVVGAVAALIALLVARHPGSAAVAEPARVPTVFRTVTTTETVQATATVTVTSTETLTATPDATTAEPPTSTAPAPLPPVWTRQVITVYTPEQARMMTGMPEGFNEYVASMLEEEDLTSHCPPSVDVYATHTDSFVYGSVGFSDCGGASFIWRDIHGGWGQVLSTQGMFQCEELSMTEVPERVAGGLECWSGNDVYDY